MQIRFTVPGTPIGKGRPKFIRATGHAYTPKKTRQYESFVEQCYLEQTRGYKFPDKTPLNVAIYAYFPIPKSASRKQHVLMARGEIRHIVKSDIDNVIKICLDAISGIAFHDDSEVVDVEGHKYYSEEPRVEIFISGNVEEVANAEKP